MEWQTGLEQQNILNIYKRLLASPYVIVHLQWQVLALVVTSVGRNNIFFYLK